MVIKWPEALLGWWENCCFGMSLTALSINSDFESVAHENGEALIQNLKKPKQNKKTFWNIEI